MARKSPKDSASQRGQVKAAIKESSDEMINRARREALEGIRRMGGKTKQGPAGPSELFLGADQENFPFRLAKGKKRKSNEGMA